MALTGSSWKRVLSAAQQVRSYSAPADRSIPAAKQKYVPTSGTYPKGFLVGTSHAGVKASNTQHDDIAMIVSEQPCNATAVFTHNLFKAAPVQFSSRLLRDRKSEAVRGVVVNSGCANAVTGQRGLEDARSMASTADACFGDEATTESPSTLVMSTGVIGQRLPMDKIATAIPKAHASLGSEHEDWLRGAEAICTTDTFPKLISRNFTLPSHPDVQYSIAGMTKGAGMIHPNMGTLLGIICTDVKIAPTSMRRLLRYASNKSFNCISIDGDTSTNDTVALLANGAAAPENTTPLEYNDDQRKISPALRTDTRSEDYKAFQTVLGTFMADLAKLVVRDGEGATKFVTIRVQSHADYFLAKSAAESIATSSLVKTALYGKDANWGRILCAIGYAPAVLDRERHIKAQRKEGFSKERGSGHDTKHVRPIDPSQTSVSFVPADGSPELKLLVRGEPENVDEERAKQILDMEDLEILVKLNDDGSQTAVEPDAGFREAVVYTCDFSHEYVTINGDYRT